MSHFVSDVDYTQPYGQRTAAELPMRFHYFLVVLAGIGTVGNVLTLISTLFMENIIPLQLGFLLIGALIQGFIFISLLFKRHWIILIYQINFWLQIVCGILSLLILCGMVFAFSNLLTSIGGALMLVGPFLIIGGATLGVNLFITRCIINYYKRRRHLLK